MRKSLGLLNRFRARLIVRKPAKEQFTFWVEMFKKTPEAKELIKEHSALLKSVDRDFLEIESPVRTSDYVHAFKRFALENRAPIEVLKLIEQSIRDIEG